MIFGHHILKYKNILCKTNRLYWKYMKTYLYKLSTYIWTYFVIMLTWKVQLVQFLGWKLISLPRVSPSLLSAYTEGFDTVEWLVSGPTWPADVKSRSMLCEGSGISRVSGLWRNSIMMFATSPSSMDDPVSHISHHFSRSWVTIYILTSFFLDISLEGPFHLEETVLLKEKAICPANTS